MRRRRVSRKAEEESDRAFCRLSIGGFVVTGFDGRLAFLLQLAGVEELFALGGIGGTAVTHVSELERHLTFQFDQFRRAAKRQSTDDCRQKMLVRRAPRKVAHRFSSELNSYRSA